MKKKIVLIANGALPQGILLKRMVDWADLVVAVDGGANHCAKLNITPDFIVGDLDSIDAVNRNRFDESEIVYLPDQNMHDFEKALVFIETLDPKEVSVFAQWGERFDHVLANLFVIAMREYAFDMVFYDTKGYLSIIKQKTVLTDAIGETISLFSFNPVYGLSLEGCKYKNKHKNYPNGFIGLSNIVTANPAVITLAKGHLLLYRLYGKN
jgi:thiamine pyrophosphokinase